MRVLFAILVVAFAGLLWATIAIAQHIRRARRRKRGRGPADPTLRSTGPALSRDGGDLSDPRPRNAQNPRFKRLQPNQ